MSSGRFCLFFTGILLVAAAPPNLRADDEVAALIKKVGDAAKYNADAVIVLDATDVRVRANGIGTARTQRVVKVLRDAAIKSQAVQRFEFDPHTNRLEVIAVRVYRADGSIEGVPTANKVQQPQPASGIFWGTQQYLISVPRLAVGDAVESISEMTGFNVAYLAAEGAGGASVAGPGDAAVQVNARGEELKPPVPGHWHDEVHFWSSLPVIVKRYTVRVPKDKPLQYEVYSGELRTAVLIDRDEIVYTFEKKDIAPFKDEPAMESTPNVGTKLLLATLPTWEDKARWLHEVSEPQFEVTDEIRAKTLEIIKDCRTDEAKWTALNHWVAENVRYAGTSRGMCEGYTTHSGIETFRDRAGVCKDKAGMLVTMLRAAGFDSFLVMTMARQRVDRVPADQFNHAVTCVRKPDGELVLLDPTWMPKSRDNWSLMEPLQHVVYGIPEGKELSQSPDFPPEMNLVQWTAETTVDAANCLRGTAHFIASGAAETRLRRALASYHPADRPNLFDETIQRLAPIARIVKATCMEPVDFAGPVEGELSFEVEGYVLGAQRRYFALPLMQTLLGERMLADVLDKTSLKERKYGLKLWATRLVKLEESIKLPAGWEVARKPDPVKLDGPAVGLKFEADVKDGTLHYTCELTIKRWQIPPEEYANFKEVMDKFTELAGRVVTCEVEAAHAQD